MAHDLGKPTGCPDVADGVAREVEVKPWPSEDIAAAVDLLGRVLAADSPVPAATLTEGLRGGDLGARRVLQALAQAGLVRTNRPSGYVTISDASARLTLADIVEALDPVGVGECLLLRTHCASSEGCGLNEVWRVARRAALHELRETRIDPRRRDA